jgi:hypothetical protein
MKSKTGIELVDPDDSRAGYASDGIRILAHIIARKMAADSARQASLISGPVQVKGPGQKPRVADEACPIKSE